MKRVFNTANGLRRLADRAAFWSAWAKTHGPGTDYQKKIAARFSREEIMSTVPVGACAPTDKAPEIEQLLTNLSGQDRRTCIEQHKCATCGKDVNGFTDTLSRQEYCISGMCQTCQDEIFKEED